MHVCVHVCAFVCVCVCVSMSVSVSVSVCVFSPFSFYSYVVRYMNGFCIISISC